MFDERELLQRLMADRVSAGRLIAGFLQDVPAKLSNLRKLLEQGDVTGARLKAHGLKGAAATLSAGALRDVALRMERAGMANDLNGSAVLLPSLEEQFQRLQAALKASGWMDTESTKGITE